MTQPHCCIIFGNKICLNYFLKLATIKGMNFSEVPTRHFLSPLFAHGGRAKFMSHGPHHFSSMEFLLKIFIFKPSNNELNVTQTQAFRFMVGPGHCPMIFKIWPITFQGSGPSGPILFSCENISL